MAQISSSNRANSVLESKSGGLKIFKPRDTLRVIGQSPRLFGPEWFGGQVHNTWNESPPGFVILSALIGIHSTEGGGGSASERVASSNAASRRRAEDSRSGKNVPLNESTTATNMEFSLEASVSRFNMRVLFLVGRHNIWHTRNVDSNFFIRIAMKDSVMTHDTSVDEMVQWSDTSGGTTSHHTQVRIQHGMRVRLWFPWCPSVRMDVGKIFSTLLVPEPNL